MKVLVVGAGGFVGRHLCPELKSRGFEVLAGVRAPGSIDDCPEVVVGDLGEERDLRGLFDDVDAVVHLAARVHVMHDTAEDPLDEYRRINTTGTRRLAEAAAKSGVRRFVFLSTVKVLGECTTGRPFAADDRPAPCDPYAVSKLEAEDALAELADKTGMDVVILRPPLVYGPGVRGNVARAMRLVARGLPLPFGMIDNKRSMVGVSNLCDLVATSLTDDRAGGRRLLVADGEDLSTTEFFELLGRCMGKPVRIFSVPSFLLRFGGFLTRTSGAIARLTESLQVDIAATQAMLDWSPPVSIDAEMARTVEWHRQNE